MSKKIITIICIVLLYLTPAIKSQSLKVGFRIEPAILFTEMSNISSVLFTPYSIYLTNQFEPVDWLSLEIKPGYLLGGDNYGGFEIGAFARIKIISPRLYMLAGINNHSNTITGVHNGGGGYQRNILFECVGFGYRTDSKFSLEIIYHWTSDKDFAYSFVTDGLSYRRQVNKQMNGILKIGFGVAWDLL